MARASLSWSRWSAPMSISRRRAATASSRIPGAICTPFQERTEPEWPQDQIGRFAHPANRLAHHRCHHRGGARRSGRSSRQMGHGHGQNVGRKVQVNAPYRRVSKRVSRRVQTRPAAKVGDKRNTLFPRPSQMERTGIEPVTSGLQSLLLAPPRFNDRAGDCLRADSRGHTSIVQSRWRSRYRNSLHRRRHLRRLWRRPFRASSPDKGVLGRIRVLSTRWPTRCPGLPRVSDVRRGARLSNDARRYGERGYASCFRETRFRHRKSPAFE
jgi:hypothetical protein